jgi:hypothetical protein
MSDGNTRVYGEGESDPTGRGIHESGAKTDAGKPQCSLLLLFGKALKAVAEVGTHGAIKYTRGGWQDVPDGINRYTDALLRHLLEEQYEEFDSDLPVLHAAQTAWNALARLELILREKEAQNALCKQANERDAGQRLIPSFSGGVKLLHDTAFGGLPKE